MGSVAGPLIAALYYANALVWAVAVLTFIPIWIEARAERAAERKSFAVAIIQGGVGHVMLSLYWVELNTAWADETHILIVVLYSILFLTSGLQHIRTATLGRPFGRWLWKAVGAVATLIISIRYWGN